MFLIWHLEPNFYSHTANTKLHFAHSQTWAYIPPYVGGYSFGSVVRNTILGRAARILSAPAIVCV
jgi:hypothetical protein